MINKFEIIIENDFIRYMNERAINEDTKTKYINDLDFYLNNCMSPLKVINEYKDYFNKLALRYYFDKRKTATAKFAISTLMEYFKAVKKLNADDYLIVKNELKNCQIVIENTIDFFNKDDIDYLLSFQYEFGKKRGIEYQLVAPLIIALSYYQLFEQMHISNLQISDVDLVNSRIRNPRVLGNKFVKEWMPLNDTVIDLLKRYLDYRRQFSLLKDNDKLIVLNGQKLNNRSINEVLNIFNDTKGNANRLSTRVNLQKIIRTRILFDLEETNGHSLIEFYSLFGLKKNTQLKTATEEYLMRANTKEW